MSIKKFDDIFWFAPKSKIKAGDGLAEGRFPFYTSSPILSKYYHTEQYFDEALIFGTGGIASIHFANEPFSTSTDCIVAIGKDKNFNTKFVYYYLYGNLHILERGFKGAGLKHISKKYIQNIDIPAFDLETQNKIVAILDKASALVQKRQKTIDLLDKLVRAKFIEMFGDPTFNNKKWPIQRLDEISSKITDGKHGDCVDEVGSGYYFLSAKDLVNGKLKYYDVREIKQSEFEEVHKRTDLKLHDILLGNTGASIGKIGIVVDEEKATKTTFQKSISIITVHDKIVNPFYLKFFFDYNRRLFDRSSSGSAMTNLLLRQIRAFEVQIPPLNLQIQFASDAKKFEAIKVQLQISLNELNDLINSTSQQAFSGKLSLDVSIELDTLLEEIDLQKSENDLFSIVTNEEYLLSLVKRLNNQEFESQDLYDKAKHVAFQLLKEEERLAQEYDEKTQSLKLVVK